MSMFSSARISMPRPFNRPDGFASWTMPRTGAPRGATTWPLATSGDSSVASKWSPGRFCAVFTDWFNRTRT
jgi:hypothetical protein